MVHLVQLVQQLKKSIKTVVSGVPVWILVGGTSGTHRPRGVEHWL